MAKTVTFCRRAGSLTFWILNGESRCVNCNDVCHKCVAVMACVVFG